MSRFDLNIWHGLPYFLNRCSNQVTVPQLTKEATIKGKIAEWRSVISITMTQAVKGARTMALKPADIPTITNRLWFALGIRCETRDPTVAPSASEGARNPPAHPLK